MILEYQLVHALIVATQIESYNYGDTQISTLFCCVGVNGQSGSGQTGSGQVYIITIAASPNTSIYTVGDLVTLMCIVDPPITSTAASVTYSWQCDDCFANGMTDMVIMRQLTETDVDAGMISCSATVDGVKFMTATPFDLEVQGMVIFIACV